MKNLSIIVLFILQVSYIQLNAQIVVNEETIRNACLILNKENKPIGTGFFLRDDTVGIYFCTAYHVLVNTQSLQSDTTYNFTSDKIIIRYNNIGKETGKILIDLKVANIFFLVKGDSINDVVIVKIAKIIGNKEKIKEVDLKLEKHVSILDKATLIGLNIRTDIQKETDIQVSKDIYMFGYPAALNLSPEQIDFDFPLVKRGIVAGFNKKNHTIIVDCMIHKGNSGSPVMIVQGNELKLIGIASQFVPYMNTTFKKGENELTTFGNSGYGIVRSIDYIEKLVNEFK